MRGKKILLIITVCLSIGLFFVASSLSNDKNSITLEQLQASAEDEMDEIDPTNQDPSINSVIPPFWGGLYLTE